MRFQGKFSADITGYRIKADAEGKPEAYVDVEIRVDKGAGDDRATAAFRALADAATKRVTISDDNGDHDEPLVASVKPTKHVVCELHEVELDGTRWITQPEIKSIAPATAGVEVIVELRIPLSEARGGAAHRCNDNVGKTLQLELNPKQGVLGFIPPPAPPKQGRKGKKAETTEPAAH